MERRAAQLLAANARKPYNARMYGHPKTLLGDDELRTALARFDRLAILMTAGASGLRATHLPLVYEPAPSGLGRFVGHMARANDHWKDFEAGPLDVMVILPGAETYISPTWYETKKQDARAVPTCNYETIHVHGRLALFTEQARLRTNVSDLSNRHEAGRAEPWKVTDAPPDYVDRLLSYIGGVEIDIERAAGKRKMSQERTADRAGVIAALDASSDPRDREVAAAMREI